MDYFPPDSMTEYKLELLISDPVSTQKKVKFEGITDDVQSALATYMTLDSALNNYFDGKTKHIIIVYRNGEEITNEQLSDDFSEYIRNLRANKS